MLIRIKENSEGIEHYFETGQKSGRDKTRDELDKRVHLSGDLNAFSLAVKHTNRSKKWKNHYWHITGSFALEDQHISEEKIKAIHQEMLEYYFCRYDPEKIIHASEIHRPIIQTGAIGQQRYIHFHMAVSKYDQETGNQIRMIPYRLNADRAFQSYLALKYGLEDPANHKRIEKPTAENLVAMQTGKDPGVNGPKKKTLSAYKEDLNRLLDGITSVDEAKVVLGDQKDITSIVFKKMKQKVKDPITGKFTGELKTGNKYLQIKTNQFPKGRPINLRGKGFEELEKLYYTPKELEERISRGKYKPLPPPDHWKDHEKSELIVEAMAQRDIFLKHQEWWKGKALVPKIKSKPIAPAKKIDYSKIEKKYAAKFEKRIKEQRVFFVIYRHNIQEEQIQGYRIWEKNNTRFLANNDLGVKIYDRADKITLSFPDDPEKRKKAVTLALSIAQAKGWDLKKMKITGSDAFKKETIRQIAEIYRPVTTAKMEPVPVKPKSYLNAVKQLKTVQGERKALGQLSKDRIEAIKIELDPQAVIDLAIKEWGLPPYHYIPVKGNYIGDKRLKRARNVIDFLTKTCNQPIAEVFKALDNLFNIQEEAQNKALEESREQRYQEQPQESDQNFDFDPDDPVGDLENNSEEDQDDDFGFRM
jgi:hypothetical protein